MGYLKDRPGDATKRTGCRFDDSITMLHAQNRKVSCRFVSSRHQIPYLEPSDLKHATETLCPSRGFASERTVENRREARVADSAIVDYCQQKPVTERIATATVMGSESRPQIRGPRKFRRKASILHVPIL